MAVTKLSNSGIATGGVLKYDSMLAGNPAYSPASYESIATVTVGAGGASNVEFTSIPATYSHLIIRGIGRSNRSGSDGDYWLLQMNGNVGANYSTHYIYGTGTAVGSGGAGNQAQIEGNRFPSDGHTANIFGGTQITILDYTSTNKLKVVRATGGYTTAGTGTETGYTSIITGSFASTSAVTSVLIKPNVGTGFKQYTRFSLYGIKVAS